MEHIKLRSIRQQGMEHWWIEGGDLHIEDHQGTTAQAQDLKKKR